MTMTGEPTAVDRSIEDTIDGATERRVPARPGADAPPIVGREVELTVIADAFADLLHGRGRVVTIIGEAGIGKSTLVASMLRLAHDAGVPAWHAPARQLEQSRPLGPLLELTSAVGLESEVGRLVDPLRDTSVRLSTDNGVEFSLVELLVDRLEATSGGQPFVVVLDDAHWVDPATVRCLRLLGTRLVDAGACLVVVSRPVPREHPLSRQLDALSPVSTALRVGPLAADAARQLVEQRLASPDLAETTAGALAGAAALDGVVEAIVASGGGNPLVLRALTAAGGRDRRTDPIVAAIETLSEQTLSILRHAAVISVMIDVDVVGELLPVRPSAILDALAEAELAGVVTRSPTWRFAHDLFHEALYASLDAPTRRAMHLETAVVLRRTGRPAADVAEHYRRGALPGNREAVDALHAAASEIASVAPSAALPLFEAAIELSGPGGASIDLLADHLRAVAWTGDLDGAHAMGHLLLGRDLAPDLVYRVRHELAFATFVRGDVHECLEHLRHAAVHAPTASLAARTASEQALASLTAADEAGAKEFAEAGLRLGQESGDAPAVGLASAVLSLAALYHFDFPTARRHAAAVDRLDRGPMGRDVSIYQPLVFAALVAFESDDEPATADLLRRARESAAATGTVWAVPLYDAIAAYTALRRGRLDDARASAQGGSSLSLAADAFAAGAWCDGMQAQIEILMGNDALAAQLVERAETAYASPQVRFGPEQAALARGWLLERAGDVDAAFAHLRGAWELFAALDFASCCLALAGDLARLAHVRGDGELSTALTEHTEELAARGGLVSHDAVRQRVRAWADADVDAMGRAAERFAEAGYLTAAALTGADQALLARERGDVAGERIARVRAAERLQAMGADAEAERVLGPVARTRPRRAAFGWDALTTTEQRVVALVAAGLSNPEIAGELVVSRRTVESHVAAALRKLGVRSRTALAAHAHQRGISPR